MATFERSGVYHSDLVYATDSGPLTVMFTGAPRDSKYKDKPRFVGFQVHGDDGKYLLNIDSDDIEQAITAVPQNQWMYLQASGDSRAGTAYLYLTDDTGPALPGEPMQPVAGAHAPPAAIQQPHMGAGPAGLQTPAAAVSPQQALSTPAGVDVAQARAPLPPNPVPVDPVEKVADTYYGCLEAARIAHERYRLEHNELPNEDIRRTATSLFINVARGG